MEKNWEKFIQLNSPDGGFLQSEEWRNFQESAGRRTHNISGENFWTNIIEHSLPVVGKYFYLPRGPIIENQKDNFELKNDLRELVELAKKNKAGWIRIEPTTEAVLGDIRKSTHCKIVSAPHAMQPREIFLMDISKPEEQLLAEMKSKTRYNIKLAEKRGVSVIYAEQSELKKKYTEEFLRLVEVTAERDGIVSHPESYYRKMLEIIPGERLKLYAAEYTGQIIAVNLVLFFGKVCTYLHGASDNANRNVMAPYLLQWRQIQDAKKTGCEKYDFGGISQKNEKWAGITRFKSGFSPESAPTVFPGSYDLVINHFRYQSYLFLQKIKKRF